MSLAARSLTTPNSPDSTTADTTSRISFPFLLLPGELRNVIYALLLTPAAAAPPRSRGASHLTPALLRTSRRLHSEATPYLYASIFRAHPTLLTSFPHHSDPAWPLTSPFYIAFIRHWHLCVRLDTDARWTHEQAAKAFSGCESLVMEVWQASFGGAGWGVLRRLEGVTGVGSVQVKGCVPRELGMWLEDLMRRGDGMKGEGWNGGWGDGRWQIGGAGSA